MSLNSSSERSWEVGVDSRSFLNLEGREDRGTMHSKSIPTFQSVSAIPWWVWPGVYHKEPSPSSAYHHPIPSQCMRPRSWPIGSPTHNSELLFYTHCRQPVQDISHSLNRHTTTLSHEISSASHLLPLTEAVRYTHTYTVCGTHTHTQGRVEGVWSDGEWGK